jgi:hypothetical protein
MENENSGAVSRKFQLFAGLGGTDERLTAFASTIGWISDYVTRHFGNNILPVVLKSE